VPGANSVGYASGMGMYNVVMTLISALFFVGSLRTNVSFAFAIFRPVSVFTLPAVAEFAILNAMTEADVAHMLYLLKVGGAFGLVISIAGWYVAIQLACASAGVLCLLPAMDLGERLFNRSKAAAIERGREVA
jgi:succinate-acetate transporter protein